MRPGPNQWESNGRPEHLREACEGSLRRLRLEQIPLYQFHRPDPKVPVTESAFAGTQATTVSAAPKAAPEAVAPAAAEDEASSSDDEDDDDEDEDASTED